MYPSLTCSEQCADMNGNKPGVLSAIPYRVDWDDPRAWDRLGLEAIYAGEESIEEVPRD